MKTTLLLILLMFFMTSCDWLDFGKKSEDSSSIGGSTNISVNTVGNTFSPSVKIGGVAYPGNSSATITKIEDGVATINIKTKLPANIAQIIGSSAKDASGNLNYDLKVKMTDEGILDYTNKNHDPLVLVRYDGSVGDKYTLEKSDGVKITREIVSKSATDDYPWSGMLIKTINVQQDYRIPGIKKFEFITNHKFGIVGIRIFMEDGTTSQIDLFSAK
jgi:hypothetical protein